ncbi:MAG: D-Ala-D-Ala carboxypeptidase family metallohydrolase [Flavobacteriales bacterium]|nr:D-Ala-D-Ala carboxypeptidase family metallohydrolase [Flavobacteriales bacterium]
MKLSPSFSLAEMLNNQTAVRHGITEQFNPPEDVVDSLKALCKKVLQPLRDSLGKPITVSSGYRCPRLNTLVGGSPTSDHMFGRAADLNFYDNGKEDNLRIAKEVMKLGLPFKQMILEGGTLDSPRWIHIAYDPSGKDNRQEILFADFSVRPTAYKPLKYKDGKFSLKKK